MAQLKPNENAVKLRDLPITEACAALGLRQVVCYDSLHMSGLPHSEYTTTHRHLSNLMHPAAHIPSPAWEPLWDKLLITASIKFSKEVDDWNGNEPVKDNITPRMLRPYTRVRIVAITENLNIGITDKMDQDTADAYVRYEHLVNWEFLRIQ